MPGQPCTKQVHARSSSGRPRAALRTTACRSRGGENKPLFSFLEQTVGVYFCVCPGRRTALRGQQLPYNAGSKRPILAIIHCRDSMHAVTYVLTREPAAISAWAKSDAAVASLRGRRQSSVGRITSCVAKNTVELQLNGVQIYRDEKTSRRN